MASNRKRQSRLGRGLSSLMAQPVPATPPAEADDDGTASDTTPQGNAATADAPSEGRPGDRTTASTAAPATRTDTGQTDVASDNSNNADSPDHTDGELLRYIPVDQLRPNPHQPRQHFDKPGLERLAASIRSDGLMQPIVVRPAQNGTDAQARKGARRGADLPGATFDIVAGERRWRAAAMAGLDHVPAIVRDLDDQALAEWALIENLQREDLNPMERAEAFQGLAQRFGLGHDEIASRVGLDRSSVSNLLRLLSLSKEVQQYVHDGTLSMGQARAIAGLTDAAAQQRLAERAIKQGLSVRQVEQLAKSTNHPRKGGNTTTEPTPGQVRSTHLADLEQQLAEQLQTKVKVRPGRKKGSGTLTIEFYSLEQFDSLMEKLGVSAG